MNNIELPTYTMPYDDMKEFEMTQDDIDNNNIKYPDAQEF